MCIKIFISLERKAKFKQDKSFRVDLISYTTESSEPKDGYGVLKFCTVSMRVLESLPMIETLSNLRPAQIPFHPLSLAVKGTHGS